MERREFLKISGATALAASLPLTEHANAQTETMENHLTYTLQDGYIDNWLTAGPLNLPIADGEYKFQAQLRAPMLQQYFREDQLILDSPIEGGAFQIEGKPLSWRYFAAEDDHLIDLSAWHPKSDYVRAWAFCALNATQAREIACRLSSNGPALVWLNGQPIFGHREFDYFNIHNADFKASLQPGANTLLIRFDQLATRNIVHTLALRLENADGVTVSLPTRATDVARRQALESAFAGAYLSRDSYGDGQEIRLHLPTLERGQGRVKVELMAGQETARSASWDTGGQAAFIALGTPDELKEGGYRVRLSAGEVSRQIEAEVAKDAFSPAPYGTHDERRSEALEYAIAHSGGLRRETARMALGRWDEVDMNAVVKAAEEIKAWKDGADGELMGLLGIFTRYGDNPKFSAGAKKSIEEAALAFRYWTDEPRQTAMTYGSENHQLTFHTAEILAGQLFPDKTFSNNGKDGAWHRAHGEKLALTWLQTRMAYGFDEWDANGYLAADMAILSHTLLAENPRLKDGARQAMHKIMFGVALGSWRGSYGVAHARTQGEYIKDARHEPMANMGRLMWGVGTWNHGIGSTVPVGCSDYRLPAVIEAIALDLPAQMWARQHQGPLPSTLGPVNTAIFKTPDFQLASAQDYRSGTPGDNQQQHIWQATLSPDANVWVNHPACISESGNRRPNFWMGQATFPRVAQWQDALIAIHKMRASDWLPWTHAYFPTFAFDESVLQDDWAFARVSDGYLALRAQGGLKMVTTGKSAYRELRSPGRENVWLCQMGRRALDGDFAQFQAKVTALPVAFDGLKIKAQTLRGDSLQFGWDGPLLLNGQEQPISNFPHFDSPYCRAPWPADTLEIKHGAQTLTLNFADTSATSVRR